MRCAMACAASGDRPAAAATRASRAPAPPAARALRCAATSGCRRARAAAAAAASANGPKLKHCAARRRPRRRGSLRHGRHHCRGSRRSAPRRLAQQLQARDARAAAPAGELAAAARVAHQAATPRLSTSSRTISARGSIAAIVSSASTGRPACMRIVMRGPSAPVLPAPAPVRARHRGSCGSNARGAAAMQQQSRRFGQQCGGGRDGCGRSAPSAAPSQPDASASVGIVGEFAHTCRQLTGSCGARACSASRISVGDGAMRPPRWRPSASSRSIVSAVPTPTTSQACGARHARRATQGNDRRPAGAAAHRRCARRRTPAACARSKCARSARVSASSNATRQRRRGDAGENGDVDPRRQRSLPSRARRRRRRASMRERPSPIAPSACSGAHLSRVLPRSNSQCSCLRPARTHADFAGMDTVLAASSTRTRSAPSAANAERACRRAFAARPCSATSRPASASSARSAAGTAPVRRASNAPAPAASAPAASRPAVARRRVRRAPASVARSIQGCVDRGCERRRHVAR